MILRLLASLSLLFLGSAAAFAQSADDFFAGGAQAYISNNIPQAREAVDQGLKLYPSDIKLKKLDELLKQQQQQQQQNQENQSQNQQQQQNQSQQNQKQQNQKQQQQQQKNQNSSRQQSQDQSEKKQGQSSGQEKKDKSTANQGRQPQAYSGQMTPEQAKKLLDAQKNDEMVLPAGKKAENEQRKPIRDW